MGVLQCSRKNCDSILCSRYSSEYGYICEECFSKLVDICCESGFKHKRIKKFMAEADRHDRAAIVKTLSLEFLSSDW